MQDENREVAVIWTDTRCDEEGYSTIIASSITDWAEVTAEELRLLHGWANGKKYHTPSPIIITKEQSSQIPMIIYEILEEAKVLAAKMDARKKKATAAAKVKAAQRAKNKDEKERKLFEALQNKFNGQKLGKLGV